MSKTQQRVQTQYDMGYSDGLNNLNSPTAYRTNQYKLGFKHAKAAQKNPKGEVD